MTATGYAPTKLKPENSDRKEAATRLSNTPGMRIFADRLWVVSTIVNISPRARGNHLLGIVVIILRRSIPACAGEPASCSWWSRMPPVYPRVCGGTSIARSTSASRSGLSPRVRGNHERLHVGLLADGSIPACAGEPSPSLWHGFAPGVYPRVCGGTEHRKSILSTTDGLSPRVRGNRRYVTIRRSMLRVYPRVCGGTTCG